MSAYVLPLQPHKRNPELEPQFLRDAQWPGPWHSQGLSAAQYSFAAQSALEAHDGLPKSGMFGVEQSEGLLRSKHFIVRRQHSSVALHSTPPHKFGPGAGGVTVGQILVRHSSSGGEPAEPPLDGELPPTPTDPPEETTGTPPDPPEATGAPLAPAPPTGRAPPLAGLAPTEEVTPPLEEPILGG
jgi:hypothetical protein